MKAQFTALSYLEPKATKGYNYIKYTINEKSGCRALEFHASKIRAPGYKTFFSCSNQLLMKFVLPIKN